MLLIYTLKLMSVKIITVPLLASMLLLEANNWLPEILPYLQRQIIIKLTLEPIKSSRKHLKEIFWDLMIWQVWESWCQRWTNIEWKTKLRLKIIKMNTLIVKRIIIICRESKAHRKQVIIMGLLETVVPDLWVSLEELTRKA